MSVFILFFAVLKKVVHLTLKLPLQLYMQNIRKLFTKLKVKMNLDYLTYRAMHKYCIPAPLISPLATGLRHNGIGKLLFGWGSDDVRLMAHLHMLRCSKTTLYTVHPFHETRMICYQKRNQLRIADIVRCMFAVNISLGAICTANFYCL